MKTGVRLLCAGVALCFLQTFALAVLPEFTESFTDSAVVPTSPDQKAYAPHLAFPPSPQPVETTGPAEVTNATQIYVLFISDSLGNTNLSDAKASTGFDLAGASSATIPGIVDPPENPNSNNLYYVAGGVVKEDQAWLLINYTPGTNATIVTNQLQVIGLDGNNNTSTNWALTNLSLIVQPPAAPPPYLEVRFYGSGTNDPSEVFLLPTCKGLEGGGFWWSNAGVTNNWTNWMTVTTNMTVTLADIGVSGTNTASQPYYSIFTTNFPNAAWFVCYGGGHLKAPTNASGQWDGTTTYGAGPNIAQPTAANTNGLWFGYEWNAFELTLDGNPEDVGDTTYINQFSIPMVIRVYTNSYADAEAGVYTNRDSSQYYKIGGWTNFNANLLSNLVSQMVSAFPNGVIRDASNVPVMVAGPSSAGSGALAPPWSTLTNDAQNAWPSFTAYFEAAKSAQPGRHAKIKDFIGLAGGKTKPTYYFYYDFDLTVTAGNALRLEGSIMVTNPPGTTPDYYTETTNLVLEIAADAGPNDNWASWAVYTAPTPANLTTVHNWYDLTNGVQNGFFTNLTAYSSAVTNGLEGTLISIAGSNLLGAVQVAFCGQDNSLIPALGFTVASDTNLTAHVPCSTLSGPIVITTTNGSGMSAENFTVDGTAVQAGPTLTPGANAPVITLFSPTNGIPAVPICSVSGDWLTIATDTETGPTNSGASLSDLFNSSFGSAVMGRIAGDLAAGFAFGFINSDITNAAYNVDGTNRPYGDSPSGSWWGGNEYPAANTNRLAYHLVNTQNSQWGNLLFTATAVTYGHPIYDRMKVYGGDYDRNVIQPPVAPNYDPNIWMAELEFFDGMASVASGGQPGPYTLIYNIRAGGTISGVATQTVALGQDGTPAEAIRDDTSVVFRAWSDGLTDNPRTDTNVQASIQVQPMFYSEGGADLAWYAGYGFTPGPGEVWSQLDTQMVPNKATTLLAEYIADTDPTDTNSFFRVTGYDLGSNLTVYCEPATTSRVYALERTTGLRTSTWADVAGSITITNDRGSYPVEVTNSQPTLFYRITVAAP